MYFYLFLQCHVWMNCMWTFIKLCLYFHIDTSIEFNSIHVSENKETHITLNYLKTMKFSLCTYQRITVYKTACHLFNPLLPIVHTVTSIEYWHLSMCFWIVHEIKKSMLLLFWERIYLGWRNFYFVYESSERVFSLNFPSFAHPFLYTSVFSVDR